MSSSDLTLLSYLKSELKRGYLLENDEERYAERREKVYTFFMIPREVRGACYGRHMHDQL